MHWDLSIPILHLFSQARQVSVDAGYARQHPPRASEPTLQ